MLPLAVVACVMLLSSPAETIKWDFDDGTTQGWAAKDGMSGGPPSDFKLYSGEVADGVWKIDISASGTVQVISSFIGYDSHLFDRVRLRFRSVHHSPTVGGFSVSWTNEHNLATPGGDPAGGAKARFTARGQSGFVFTTEWQEVDIALPALGGVANWDETENVWEGMLHDIRVRFFVGPLDGVEFFEIDWIELTGVEERLQGELPPSYVDYFRFEGHGRFAPPVFHPITPKLGDWVGFYDSKFGVLTDLDGDGDLDLFSSWTEGIFDPSVSWVMALNDGTGAFRTARFGPLESKIYWLLAGDLTGEGQDQIALAFYNSIAIWSVSEDLQIEERMQIKGTLAGMEDADGDGGVELFVARRSEADEFYLEVWDVEQGVWTVSQVKGVSQHHWPAWLGDFTGDGRLDALWLPLSPNEEQERLMVAPVGNAPDVQEGTVFTFDYWVEIADYHSYDDVVAGDFDGDGQADLLTSLRQISEGRKGLVLRRGQHGDGMEEEVLYDDRLFVRSLVLVEDLDGDGVGDWVFVGGDRASGVGVFVAWGGLASIPHAVETYRLDGDGVEVLPGDVDGDGDLDLVVLDHLYDGVHVLKSLVADQTTTAVQMPAVAHPAQHRLGDSYPNPFNPAVVLPLDVATDAAVVSLRVYDVLGRRVRQVWQGPLRAGSYRFTWDGRDEQGEEVAAGVYLYQVEIDGQVEAKKTTKLP